MQFRKFGKLNWKVSALGFGAMRLPTTDDEARGSRINEAEAIRIMRHAIDEGVNYIDTAYPYHDGKSELVVGKALQDGYRDKIWLATKSPVWLIESEADFDRYLQEQLEKLGTDHIDCYMLHALDRDRWRNVVLKHNVLKHAEEAIRNGSIRHLGFSFHDEYETFEEILRGYDRWSFCQIQYNYIDTENQAGTKGLKLAADTGLAVIVMEPLLGGRLANPPAPIHKIMDEFPTQRSAADWALQWLWDQPEVSVVLSGMSSMEQVEQNLASASRARIGSFTASDHGAIAGLQQAYRERLVVQCTKCNYCMPCPNGVNIPRNFELFNDAYLHEDVATSRFIYQNFFPTSQHAAQCIACKECEESCPQGIPVSKWMPKVSALLGPPAA